MKILIVSFLLVPALASAQPYQSPATVAKRAQAKCATLPPQQRAECNKQSKAEIRASIARHHEQRGGAAGKPAAKARENFPKAEHKKTQ